MKAPFFAVVLLLGLVSNGHAASTKKVYFAVIGGYNSCNADSNPTKTPNGISFHPHFRALAKTLKGRSSDIEVQSVAYCLDTDGPPEGEGQYTSSDKPKEIKYADFYGLKKLIENTVKAAPSTPIFLVGHSYGGWISMALTQEFKGLNVQGLFTIDPISPDCGALEVAWGDAVCHQAPDDLDNAKISKQTKAWVNFYQDDDSWITSSSIAEAENHHITSTWGPHGQIDQHEDVWKRIEEVVVASLKPAP